jgi:hypothetical protein
MYVSFIALKNKIKRFESRFPAAFSLTSAA